MKYASIVPLIGGMTLGNELAFGKPPEYLLSYEAFRDNEVSLVSYYKKKNRNIPYHVIDQDGTFPDVPRVDYVSTVCPCAGLSMLNSTGKESTGKARGGCAVQNYWMYKTANYVLSTIRPRVMMGENAPGLATKMGEEVVEELRAIGEKYGYSFSLVKTDTYLHGIPQHRRRTFYYFWDSEHAPVLNYYNVEPKPLHEYLKEVPADASQQYEWEPRLKNHPTYLFFKHLYGDNWRQVFIETKQRNAWQIMLDNDLMHDYIDFCYSIEADEKYAKRAETIIEKVANGKGFWPDCLLYFNDDYTNAMIIKSAFYLMPPHADRSYTVREMLHMMGHPHDFDMETKLQHVFQNVPVTTAADWTREAIKYIHGQLESSGKPFLIQDNHKRRILNK